MPQNSQKFAQKLKKASLLSFSSLLTWTLYDCKRLPVLMVSGRFDPGPLQHPKKKFFFFPNKKVWGGGFFGGRAGISIY